jgi:hypothetical protein
LVRLATHRTKDVRYAVYARMELPSASGMEHLREPVVVHSKKWRRATTSETSFVWFVDTDVLSRVGNVYSARPVIGFASVRAVLSVALPASAPAELMVLVDLWKVESSTFGDRKANDIEAPQFAACVPLKMEGGMTVLRGPALGGRLVFLRHPSDKKRGTAMTEWNAPPLRNPPVV